MVLTLEVQPRRLYDLYLDEVPLPRLLDAAGGTWSYRPDLWVISGPSGPIAPHPRRSDLGDRVADPAGDRVADPAADPTADPTGDRVADRREDRISDNFFREALIEGPETFFVHQNFRRRFLCRFASNMQLQCSKITRKYSVHKTVSVCNTMTETCCWWADLISRSDLRAPACAARSRGSNGINGKKIGFSDRI